jgi:hypothetical protein
MKTAGIAIAGYFWYNKRSARKKVTSEENRFKCPT